MINQIKNLNIGKRIADFTTDNIGKCAKNNKTYSKFLLGASIGLDAYSSVIDYIEIGQNKKLEEDDKAYLKAYNLSKIFISASSQTAAGLFIMSDKSQNFIRKKIPGMKNAEKAIQSGIINNVRNISMLLGAVVITKRVLVPLLVTPIASVVKDLMNKSDKLTVKITENTQKPDKNKETPGVKYNNQLTFEEFNKKAEAGNIFGNDTT